MQKRVLIRIVVSVVIFLVAVIVSFYFSPYLDQILQNLAPRKELKFHVPVTNRVTTESVNITGCQINPEIAGFVSGSSIRFINDDNLPHVLYFRLSKFTVPAKSYFDSNLDFLKPASSKKYDCDSNKEVGMIVVFPLSTSTPNSKY